MRITELVEREELDELFGLGRKSMGPTQIKQRLAQIQQRKEQIYRDASKRDELAKLAQEQETLTQLLRQQTPH